MGQRLLIVGEILVEFVRPERGLGLESPGPFVGPFPSGAPAIAASAAALSGADVSLVATVGSDPFGRVALNRLRADRVNVSGVRVTEDAVTGTAFVAYDRSGGREFVFHVADAAPGRANPEDLGTLPEHSEWIHVSGASLALSPAIARTVMDAVERVMRAGGRVSFDPNLRPASSGTGVPEGFARLLQVASIVLPSENEIEALEVDVQALVRRGVIVGEKRGPFGVRLHLPEGTEDIPGIDTSEVDPTGAGDTFAGVFLALYLSTGDPRKAAHEANRAGAAHVGVIGPMERAPGWLG